MLLPESTQRGGGGKAGGKQIFLFSSRDGLAVCDWDLLLLRRVLLQVEGSIISLWQAWFTMNSLFSGCWSDLCVIPGYGGIIELSTWRPSLNVLQRRRPTNDDGGAEGISVKNFSDQVERRKVARSSQSPPSASGMGSCPSARQDAPTRRAWQSNCKVIFCVRLDREANQI